MSERKYWGQIPHWNNFTLAELKEILMHCRALERLGIAQDEKMMATIEADISLLEKKSRKHIEGYEKVPIAGKQQRKAEDYLLASNV